MTRRSLTVRVCPFSPASFPDLLQKLSHTQKGRPLAKWQFNYLTDYLTDLGAKTLIIEPRYIDRAYLDDFSAYYARCFADYPKHCVRMHFFRSKFSQKAFDETVDSQPPASSMLSKNVSPETYLGFLVLRPLPFTVIGRTCLNAPCNQDGYETFCISSPCESNLCGLDLSLKTLPFQEQDQVLSKCATMALWSVFHSSANLFNHPIPSPVEVTRAATAGGPMEKRAIPNSGLDIWQLVQAIRSVGMEPHGSDVRKPTTLKATAYAYMRAGLSGVLAIDLIDAHKGPARQVGGHAVALAGFRIAPDSKPSSFVGGLKLRSSRIDTFFVHDDQVGPFAKMIFDSSKSKWVETDGDSDHNRLGWCLSTEWPPLSPGATTNPVKAAPFNLLFPVYHKIRIPFDTILTVIDEFNTLLDEAHTFLKKSAPVEKIEWDIHLTTINQMKAQLREMTWFDESDRKLALRCCWPKFLWRALGRKEEHTVIDIWFDATDIEQGEYCLMVAPQDSDMKNLLSFVVKNASLNTEFYEFCPKVFDALLRPR